MTAIAAATASVLRLSCRAESATDAARGDTDSEPIEAFCDESAGETAIAAAVDSCPDPDDDDDDDARCSVFAPFSFECCS
eukprot:ANDGO_06922.mRNA.1 hypothetical protein